MLRTPLIRHASVMAFLVPLLGLTLMAQSERGTITGTIRDTSGAVIAGAKITVNNGANGLSVALSSNEAGEYTAPSLSVGTYVVRVEKDGFRPSSVTGLTLNAATTMRADVTLLK